MPPAWGILRGDWGDYRCLVGGDLRYEEGSLAATAGGTIQEEGLG